MKLGKELEATPDVMQSLTRSAASVGLLVGCEVAV
jgi:hypothetical protein